MMPASDRRRVARLTCRLMDRHARKVRSLLKAVSTRMNASRQPVADDSRLKTLEFLSVPLRFFGELGDATPRPSAQSF